MIESWGVCFKCGKPSDMFRYCNDCMRSTVAELVGREQANHDTRLFVETDAVTHYRQQIASLEADLLAKADQIGGLASELERAKRQAELCEAGARHIDLMREAAEQQLAQAQAREVALRETLEDVWSRFGYDWNPDKPAPQDWQYQLLLKVRKALVGR